MNSNAGVWVKAERDIMPKIAGLYTCMIEEKGDGEKSQYPAFRKYNGHNFLLAENETLLWWLNEDEQPIPVNQDSCIKMRTAFCKTTIYGEDSNELYQLYKWIISKAGITAAEFYATSEEYNKMSEQLKSSPSPTPVKNDDYNEMSKGEIWKKWQSDKKYLIKILEALVVVGIKTTGDLEKFLENPQRFSTPVQEGLREDEKK